MFEKLGYNSKYHTKEGVQNMLKNTFMENGYADNEKTKTYADAFIDAGIKNNVSPYVLVARVVQEVGAQGSTIVSGTVKGYEGYYNFYNINATGSQDQIITNGLKHAKEMGWNSPYKAIVGGGSFLSDNYIDEGQDTLYLQKWDLFGPMFGNHQYQQNIQAPSTESIKTFNGYNKSALLDNEFVFSIPVFQSIPNSTKLDNKGNPNNYLKSLKVNDKYLFESATHDTTFDVTYDESVTSLKISATAVNSKSIISGTGSVSLTGVKQSVVVSVTAENGAVRDYVINVKRNVKPAEPDPDKPVDPEPIPTPTPSPSPSPSPNPSPTVITIKDVLTKAKVKYDEKYFYGYAIGTKIEKIVNDIKNIDKNVKVTSYNRDSKAKNSGIIASGDKITIKTSKEEKSYTIVIYGDINGDGAIDKLDASTILRKYYGYTKLNENESKFADINKDGNIDKLDALAILRDLYGYSKITQ